MKLFESSNRSFGNAMRILVLLYLVHTTISTRTLDKDVGFDPSRLNLNLHSVFSRIRSLNSVPKGTIKTLELAVRFTPQVKNESKLQFKQFFNFIARYQKSYGDNKTLSSKFHNFQSSIARINVLQRTQPRVRFELNQFADYSQEEFVRTFTGVIMTAEEKKKWKKVDSKNWTSDSEVRWKRDNSRFDWRDKGVVTSVKNQYLCGACYAFSIVGAVESAYAIKTKRHIEASVQQVIACSDSLYCRGGYMSNTMDYIVSKGLTLEKDYPYISMFGYEAECSYKTTPLRYIKSYLNVQPNEKSIIAALKKYGPLPAVIDARPIKFYKSGIVSVATSDTVTHAVLIVGYGTEKGTPYWIVKNSWSTYWGENGYFRVIRGRDCLSIESYVMAVVA